VLNYSGHLTDYKVEADRSVLRIQTSKDEVFKEGEELGFAIRRAMLFAQSEVQSSQRRP
jgi:hypothetical protein